MFGSVWGLVTEGNCVLARGGGEQPQVNVSSVAQANSIRPAVLASLRVKGEAQRTLLSQAGMSLSARAGRDAVSPVGNTPDRQSPGGQQVVGGGRDGRFVAVNKGDLPDSARGLRGTNGTRSGHTQPTRPAVRVGAARRYEQADATPVRPVPAGVRAPIVAWKPGNAGGAKGCREVEA